MGEKGAQDAPSSGAAGKESSKDSSKQNPLFDPQKKRVSKTQALGTRRSPGRLMAEQSSNS